jgi:hypothetical protein
VDTRRIYYARLDEHFAGQMFTCMLSSSDAFSHPKPAAVVLSLSPVVPWRTSTKWAADVMDPPSDIPVNEAAFSR